MGSLDNGGPKLRSGRMPGPRADRRSELVRIMMRPAEAADLKAIADAWGVPLGTAAWAIVHEQLARYRRAEPKLGEAGLAIAAALRVLRQKAASDERSPRSSSGDSFAA